VQAGLLLNHAPLGSWPARVQLAGKGAYLANHDAGTALTSGLHAGIPHFCETLTEGKQPDQLTAEELAGALGEDK
jgi:hypothetical protein